MAELSFKNNLKALPTREKLVFIGGFLAILGTFLPWYKDVDRFQTGDTFLGISGPLYLAGMLVLLCGIMSFGIILMKLLNKRIPKLPFPESYMHLGGAGFSVLMLILTYSVYFHPKFGINLTEKTVGTGMIMAIIGVGLVIFGGVLEIKKKEISFEEEGKLEKLINMNDRVQSDIMPKEEVEKTPFGTEKSIHSFLEEDAPHQTNINNQF
jgi:hypothetical protein